MSHISYRFFVQTIDDGTTLHGELRSIGSLSQAWSNGSAVPNWGAVSGKYPNSPLIYLTLMSGSTEVSPTANTISWEHNGTAITFSSTQTQLTFVDEGGHDVVRSGYLSTDNLFFKTSYTIGVNAMPALAIVGNLASSNHVDVDTITIKGGYPIGAANIGFSATAQVRITEIKGNGNLGQVNFVDGISDITQKGQTITAYGRLYNQEGNLVSNFTTKWYLNDGAGVNGQTYDGHPQAYRVTEGDVVDFATLKCEFYVPNQATPVYTEIVGIDDRQDTEYLFVQMNNANGNAASLHSEDPAVVFNFFVGDSDNPTPENGHPYSGWTFKVKLYDKEGNEVTGNIGTGDPKDIPDVVDGYRPLRVVDYKGIITIPFDKAKQYFNGFLSGIIYANHA